MYDPAADRGVIARDQIGGPGLHWTVDGRRLVLGSEVVDVLALLRRTPGPDRVTLGRWLSFGGPPDGRTFHAGVRSLRGGHLLRFGSDGVREERWWTPGARGVGVEDFDEAAEGLLARLDTALDRHLPEHRRAGVMLSGGLDSATVAGVAARRDARVRSYSAVFPHHPRVDEAHAIGTLREAYGIGGVEAVVGSGSVIDGALPYVDRWRQPPPSPNLFFWTPLLERAAADGVDVMLDGEGGDEVFGTVRYALADLVRGGRPRAAARMARRFPGGATAGRRRVAEVLWEYAVRPALPPSANRGLRRAGGARRAAPEWLRPASRASCSARPTPGRGRRRREPAGTPGSCRRSRAATGPSSRATTCACAMPRPDWSRVIRSSTSTSSSTCSRSIHAFRCIRRTAGPSCGPRCGSGAASDPDPPHEEPLRRGVPRLARRARPGDGRVIAGG